MLADISMCMEIVMKSDSIHLTINPVLTHNITVLYFLWSLIDKYTIDLVFIVE